MRNTKTPIDPTRRAFCRDLARAGLGAALRGSPLVAGLFATKAAYASGRVKRVAFVYTTNGAPKDLWLPNGRVLNQSTLAFEGLQEVCHFREVRVENSGHGNIHKAMGLNRWNGDWTGDTLDHQLGSVLGSTTPYKTFTLGVQTPGQHVSRHLGQFVPAQSNPAAAYQQLFSAPPSGDAREGFVARKQSAFAANRAALAEIRNRLGSFERDLLDRHEAALAEVESRLTSSLMRPPEEACSRPSWNANGYPTSRPAGSPPGVFLHDAELQCDIMVAALRCGLTNVMTLQLGGDQAEYRAHDTMYRGTHHGACHSAPAAATAEMTNYLSRVVAYLVRKLLDTDDPAVPGTKMLDNTVVVQVTDMGDGRDHTGERGPSLIATRMPAFRVGVVTQGGTNYQVLEALIEGLGLGAFKGTDRMVHKIWPHGGGQIADGILA